MSSLASFSLQGQHAFITGATRGIGFAIASGLAEAGASVTLTGRQRESLDEAVSYAGGDLMPAGLCWM